jgi:hypothetical protein
MPAPASTPPFSLKFSLNFHWKSPPMDKTNSTSSSSKPASTVSSSSPLTSSTASLPSASPSTSKKKTNQSKNSSSSSNSKHNSKTPVPKSNLKYSPKKASIPSENTQNASQCSNKPKTDPFSFPARINKKLSFLNNPKLILKLLD